MSTDTSLTEKGVATYLPPSGDRSSRFTDYYPAWLDNLADDVTVEGSMLIGAVQGPGRRPSSCDDHSVVLRIPRVQISPVLTATTVWVEDYIAQVGCEPIGCVVLVSRNAAGQTQHVVASYPPLNSLLLFSRLLREKFAETIAQHFAGHRGSSTAL